MSRALLRRAMAVLQGDRLPSVLQELLEAKYKIVWMDQLDVTSRREEIKAILVHHSPRNEALSQLMRELPNLRAVVSFGVGINHIDLNLAKQLGIHVSNTPNCLNAATADLAFGILLAVARNIVSGDTMARHPSTHQFDLGWFGTEVNSSVIGIVGMGRIGIEIAKRARGFDMKVIYHNRGRRPEEDEAKVQATFCPNLRDLLQQSDYVVVAVPLAEETKKMFKTEQFAAMKKTAFFVNICRGGVVDHDALIKALETKQIAGAALDVTDPEPLPRDHPLLGMKNVVITPHLGSASVATRKKMILMCMDNLEAALNDKELPNQVV